MHIVSVRVEWTDEFDRWLSRIEEQAEAGDEHANRQLDYNRRRAAVATRTGYRTERDHETAS